MKLPAAHYLLSTLTHGPVKSGHLCCVGIGRTVCCIFIFLKARESTQATGVKEKHRKGKLIATPKTDNSRVPE